jgi:hypothetical protein
MSFIRDRQKFGRLRILGVSVYLGAPQASVDLLSHRSILAPRMDGDRAAEAAGHGKRQYVREDSLATLIDSSTSGSRSTATLARYA